MTPASAHSTSAAEAGLYKIAHSLARYSSRRKKINLDCILVDSLSDPHIQTSLSAGFQEAIVTKNLVLADVATKTAYFSMAVASFVFVSMLLLTGLHF
jgi:hypothetical protein